MKKKIIITLSIIILLVIIGIIVSLLVINNNKEDILQEPVNDTPQVIEEEPYVSDFEWEYDTPQNHNMNADVFNQIDNSIINTEITSSVVVKDGKILYEYYKDGYDENSIFTIQSCSKSITSAIFGIAKDQGYFTDLDEPISNYFPQIQNSNNEYQKQITIRQLLMHTSGIKTTDDYSWETWRNSSNWIDYLLNSDVLTQPGTNFSYSTGNTHLLSYIIEQKTGRSLYDFGKEYLFDSIGMKTIQCSTDPQGNADGGNGFSLTAKDMARFGLLYLNGGVWDERQVISQEWITESTSTQVFRSSTPDVANYGYQWWIRDFGTQGVHGYFAQGFGGQFIFVVPDANLVVTYTSNYADNRMYPYWQYVDNLVDACNI